MINIFSKKRKCVKQFRRKETDMDFKIVSRLEAAPRRHYRLS